MVMTMMIMMGERGVGGEGVEGERLRETSCDRGRIKTRNRRKRTSISKEEEKGDFEEREGCGP